MKTFRKHWLQIVLSTLLLVAFTGHAARWWALPAVGRLDLFLYDTRLALTMPNTVDPRVVVVDIDEKSLAEIGRWPWRRDILARLIEQLTDHYKTAVVGFDIVFAERDESSGLPILRKLAETDLKDEPGFQRRFAELQDKLDFDARFAQSLKSRPVVLGYYFNHDKRGDKVGKLPPPVLNASAFKGTQTGFFPATGYAANLDPLVANAASAGHFNPGQDEDGVTRRVGLLMLYEGQFYESLSLAMVRTYLGSPELQPVFGDGLQAGIRPLEQLNMGPLQLAVDDRAQALVPFRGPQMSFRYVSAADVLAGRVAPEWLAGRMVLVGTTAPGLKDLRVAPVDPYYPGVEIHATLISGMLDNQLPSRPGYLQGAEVLQLFLIGATLLVVLIRLSPLSGALVTASLLLILIGSNFALWEYGALDMPLASSLLLILFMYASSVGWGYFFVSRTKKHMTQLFGQYAPPELVEKMSEEPQKYSMEGQSRELTVLFSDVRGFTSLSESMEPKELAQFMNTFLTTLTEVIRNKHLGTIDKYMGDCIMAFWGAPVDAPDHAHSAVIAGLEMQRAMAALVPTLQEKGWPPINIGIGVNTGRMTVGDMGSQIRKAYTVMGDAVNLSSRLEGITKYYGVGMLVGESTRRAAGDDIVFRELDRIRVKGRYEPVTIFEPICEKSQANPDLLKDIDAFHQVLRHYRSQNWDLAELQLLQLQQNNPDCMLYQVYLERVSQLRQEHLPADWGGVHDFDSK